MAIVAPIVSTFNDRGIRQARDAFGGLSRGLGTVFRGIAVGLAGAGVAGAAGLTKAIGAASDLGEAISANEQIFGGAADEILRFAEGAATTLGQSTQTVLDGARTFGVFGKAAGLADGDLADFATEFSTLASDLGSFYNEDPAAVIEALGAGLRGESEPLRRFGVLLNDATLKQEALNLGIYDGEGALTDQQKILAAQSAIFAQTTDAQGDFARTSGGLANQQRILKARLENVVAQLGKKFLPIATRLAGFLLNRVVPVIEKLVAIFDRDGLAGVLRFVADEFRSALPQIFARLREFGAALVAWIGPQIGPTLERLRGWLETLGAWIVDVGLPWLGARLAELGRALLDWIGPRIGPAVETLRGWLETLGAWILETGLPWLGTKLAELGDALVAWIGPKIRPAVDAIADWLAAAGTWILDVGLPKLVDWLRAMGDQLVEWIRPMIRPTLEQLGLWLAQLGVWIITTAVPKLLELAAKLLAAMVEWTFTLTVELVKGLKDAFTASSNWLSTDGFRLIGDALDALADWIIERLRSAAGAVRDWAVDIGARIVSGIVDGIKSAPGAIANALAGVIPGGGKAIAALRTVGVPFLADGGIVPGPTLAMIGEAGPEAVIPLDRLGQTGGPTTIINVSGALDPTSVAEQIRRLLNDDARRRGAAVL